MTFLDFLNGSMELVDDLTEYTLIKNGRQIRGKWYEDKVFEMKDCKIENINIHVSHNSCQILLK